MDDYYQKLLTAMHRRLPECRPEEPAWFGGCTSDPLTTKQAAVAQYTTGKERALIRLRRG